VSGALDPAAAARALVSARQAGRTLDVLLSAEAGLSLADAYRVQDQVTALRLAGGERRAGWKLGYTSAVMRAQMGIDAPNFGPLTDAIGPEYVLTSNVIAFPRRGTFVMHYRGERGVIDPTRAVFHNPGDAFRTSHPGGEGDDQEKEDVGQHGALQLEALRVPETRMSK